MAYAALVSLAQTIEQTQNNDQYSFSLHKKQQIMSIGKHVVLLQAFLDEFPEKANSFESRINEVVNKAEDIIEGFMWEQIQTRHQLINPTVEPARYKLEKALEWMVGSAKRTFKHHLKKVIEEIESLAEQVMEIMNSVTTKDAQITDPPAASFSSSSSVVHTHGKDAMVGFDDDLLAIKERLCGESSRLQVIPIVGMGGIGKTTLARNIYDGPLTVEHFYIRVWVTISQDYIVERILSSLLGSIKKLVNMEIFGQNDEEKVYKSLKGMRYLIVLDDVWSTEVWDDLRLIFPDDHNGSRIMLTTRLLDVAAYADSSSRLHCMRFMDEDQSWVLLQQKVFKGQNCPPKLEYIGRRIARSCGGLPMAIAVIGGILSTVSKTRVSWEEIEENVNSVVSIDGGEFERILSLSYTHLPHHLRPCFLYMACFPEDDEIRVSELIRLWVAEGFLKYPNGSKNFEEVAEEYLEDLVRRSLFLVYRRDSTGNIKSCGVHDLVRDLCIRKAHENKFLVRDLNVLLKSTENQRRISVNRDDLDLLAANISSSNIRTIVSFSDRPLSSRFFKKFKLLRVVRGIDHLVELLELHDTVFESFYLRYLSIACYTKNIPTSISNLQNLQTLVIHYSDYRSREVFLPFELWRMPQLRHILTRGCKVILPNPEGSTFALENLQTLATAKNLVCRERTMKMIQNLKKLRLFYSGVDPDYSLENLDCLHQLESLELRVIHLLKLNPVFPLALKKLTLAIWENAWKCMAFVGRLPNLEVLKLKDFQFHHGKWETVDGEFRQLKFLLIEGSDLKEWITEIRHFPRLKYLLFYKNRHLKEIPDGIGEIPTLEMIAVEYCHRYLEQSAKTIQEEQQSFGNDSLQVRFHEVNMKERKHK